MDDFSPNQLLQHVFKSKHSVGSLDDTGRCNAPMCEVFNSILTYHGKTNLIDNVLTTEFLHETN